ncbi:MAG: hypothetical protein CVT75_08290 [Alphaproteobacteria bacterium HGW-Alphaproteobacteria-14]|nr:MAG: hypothetical protein CVT75_08290 [Alphaproteobacteria bacterium HGW-Alphaproteobacteria-14]
MLTSLLAAALMLQAAPTQTPALSQENRALLRCAAAFAVVSQRQAIGDPAAGQWPDLATRGREFFVRAMAQLMDQTGLDRDGIAWLAGFEAKALRDSGETDRLMPSCLLMLEASGV